MREIRMSLGSRSLVALMLCAASVLWGGCLQKTERAVANDEIHAAFRRFKDAVVAGDGESAARELSAETIAYYRRLRGIALHAAPDELRRIPIEMRLEVLTLRGRVSAKELQQLEGPELAVLFINRGWVNRDMIGQIDLNNVIHTPRGAEARYSDDRGPSRNRLAFRREQVGWKFDLSATQPLQRKILLGAKFSRGVSEDELLAELLRETLPSSDIDDLWQPLAPAFDQDESA